MGFVIPTGAQSFSHAMAIGCEVFHNLKAVIKAKFGGDATLIGDEGGFAPPCSVDSGLEMLMEAIDKAGHSGVCTVGLDVASSEFKVEGENAYDLDFKTSGADKDTSLKLSGDDPVDHRQGHRPEGLQLSVAQGEPDRLDHGVD